MKTFVMCLMPVISTCTWGEELCTRNSLQVDVCRVATTISQTIAEELPLRLNQSLVLQHIAASDNRIRMRAVLDYTEAHLIQTMRAGVTLDAMRTSVRQTAIVIMCRPKTQLQAFIELGGQLQFVYLFSDKAHFLTVNVSHCSR
jgi:hypothetical protein